MSAPSLASIIRAEREAGATLRQIADDLGISYSFVQRIAQRHGIVAPRELRGRWRTGRKGSTRAQDLAHASPRTLPSRVINVIERAGSITESKRQFWSAAS